MNHALGFLIDLSCLGYRLPDHNEGETLAFGRNRKGQVTFTLTFCI